MRRFHGPGSADAAPGAGHARPGLRPVVSAGASGVTATRLAVTPGHAAALPLHRGRTAAGPGLPQVPAGARRGHRLAR
jgi:hypothetical protein